MNTGIEALPDDIEALKALLIAERHTVLIARAAQLEAEALAAIAQAQVADARAIIEDLKLRIPKARQDKWGQSSERHRQLLDQLEMQLEDVVATATEDELAAEIAVAKACAAGVPVVPFTRKKPTRAPLSADLPRHRVVVPAPESCPCCHGAELKKIGETITESREVVPRKWIVVQTVREKFICKACDIVTRMDAIFAAERVIWGRNASDRLALRQVLVAELEQFLRQQYGRLSRKGDLAKAINYMLTRWGSFARFVSDGRICMTNNAAERRVRTVAVGRRNWTFCGSDRGGDRAAAMYTLIQTCRLNDVDPHAWLRDVIAQISDHPQTRLHELLPWEWKARQQRPEAVAQAT